jgi:hypothetical protein
MSTIRFAAFIREITLHQDQISYNQLTPKQHYDEQGCQIPYRAPAIRLRPIDAYRLIQPYVSVRFIEQLRAVLPLAAYLIVFQIVVLRQEIVDAWIISGGLIAVILGLMFFMEGLKVGLMPFGEALGTTLPAHAPLTVVLMVVFILGIGVTFAEPAIGALKTAGQLVAVESAPYLYMLLTAWADWLILGVGLGVGLAALLGTVRFLYGWSLKPFIYCTLVPALALTGYLLSHDELTKILGLAWDCGAVTTGPVTVPLVLSLGIGISAAAGKEQNSLSGFGIVTLASLLPIISVELLAIILMLTTTPEQIIAHATSMAVQNTTAMWTTQTPWVEIINGLRAIVPLVLFLFLVMKVLLKERFSHPGQIVYGITLATIGMIIFNLGLTYGLTKLGGQAGNLIPSAFTVVEHVAETPLYRLELGLAVAFIFAWILGFGATLAEPALNALGLTVENLTNGALRKTDLMYAVSVGVAFGLVLGVLKIIVGFSIAWLLIPGYLFALLLTVFSNEEFVNIAWDSAGVTTGPVTVPLVLAMGLGFGQALEAIDGFGILAMASICPIISVLVTGLWIQWKIKRKHRQYDQDWDATGQSFSDNA